MVGYPFTLQIIEKLFVPKQIYKDFSNVPNVTYMISAHNEEKVIKDKLENALQLAYPKDKLEILVASDYCTDETNQIVERFINDHPNRKIRIYKSKDHKGKTNAQNEAQKTISSEFIVMSDANTHYKSNAINELMATFTSDDIKYVCGSLFCINENDSLTSNSESIYWDIDRRMRDIESRLSSITAGIGSIYACRTSDYVAFPPIECHDSSMPRYYVIRGGKALYNPEAIAYEKAGENDVDEFKRKVRQNRVILDMLKYSFVFFNVFKYRWYSLFWFGHRFCRYSLWLSHFILFVCSIALSINNSIIGMILILAQILWLIDTFVQIKYGIKNKFLRLLGYYGMTVVTQIVAIYNILTGRAKPTWEKAESTR